MRGVWLATTAGALALSLAGSADAKPDQAFSDAFQKYVADYQQEARKAAAARGQSPTSESLKMHLCLAMEAWKARNPGGEARLTLIALTQLRRAEYFCRKPSRHPPFPDDGDDDTPPPDQPPPETPPPPETHDGDAKAYNDAIIEFTKYHPEEFTDAPTEDDYVRRRLFIWDLTGEGARLAGEANDAYEGAQGPPAVPMGPDAEETDRQARDRASDEAAKRYQDAKRAEAQKAHDEWRAKHPDAPTLTDSPITGSYPTAEGGWAEQNPRGGMRILKPDGSVVVIEETGQRTTTYPDGRVEVTPPPPALRNVDPPLLPGEEPAGPDYKDGTVDPLDTQRWADAGAQPIVVGSNTAVGSGARARQKAVSTVLGVAGSVLGGGGGGSSQSGPALARCRIDERAMTLFEDPATGVGLRVAAQPQGQNLVVYAAVASSPDAGTFQTAYLQDARGNRLAPSNAQICKLHGEWRLSVSWTRSTYVDGRMTNRETGGWNRTGQFAIPGLVSSPSAPDGLWNRLGFSNASHGARMVALTFPTQPGQLSAQPLDLVLHVTRPAQNPVTTAPFALRLQPEAQGIAVIRRP